jgi:hypothetical protein
MVLSKGGAKSPAPQVIVLDPAPVKTALVELSTLNRDPSTLIKSPERIGSLKIPTTFPVIPPRAS